MSQENNNKLNSDYKDLLIFIGMPLVMMGIIGIGVNFDDIMCFYYDTKLEWSLSDSEDLVEDYQEECNKQKWEKAYAIAETFRAERDRAEVTEDKCRKSIGDEVARSRGELYEEALHYITLQESLFVLEQSGINGIARIVAIAKEHDVEAWLYEQLVEISYRTGDLTLIEKIEQLYVGQACDYQKAYLSNNVYRRSDEVNAIIEKIRYRRDSCPLDERKFYWDELHTKAVRFIVLKEATALLGQMDNKLSKRETIDDEKMSLVCLAKKYEVESWLYDELIDTANKSGKKALAKQLSLMK